MHSQVPSDLKTVPETQRSQSDTMKFLP
jgi:hypothetical protein